MGLCTQSMGTSMGRTLSVGRNVISTLSGKLPS